MSIDLLAYARRVGLRALPSPTLEGLFALHEAQVLAMPFENLDVLLRRPIALDLQALEAKLVHARRGGYCFELNGLFYEVLKALGFSVEAHLGRVHLARPEGEIPPRTHRVTVLSLEGKRFLVDVGFGAPTPRRPIELVLDTPLDVFGDRFRLRNVGALGTLLEVEGAQGFSALYSFTDERAYPIDFELSNHYTSSHPRSRFFEGPRIARTLPEGRITMSATQIVEHRGGHVSARPTPRGEALRAVLEESFGLCIDEAPSF